VKTSILIQARLGSSRLPGKVLLPLAGEPMIWHVVKRCQAVDSGVHVAVVTTTEKKDDRLTDYLKSIGVDVFRGSEQDVLDRYRQAAVHFKSDVIARVTSDCPLLDPLVTARVISACNANVDFSTNVISRTFPRGLDTEVITFATLDRVSNIATESGHREHVTKYIYDNPERFKIVSVENHEDLSSLRWTVDEQSDYELASQIYSKLYRAGTIFQTEDVVALLKKDPALASLNAAVMQKLH
jgi:spore coat polysaccharide biosynthesis protein SpsF